MTKTEAISAVYSDEGHPGPFGLSGISGKYDSDLANPDFVMARHIFPDPITVKQGDALAITYHADGSITGSAVPVPSPGSITSTPS